MAFKKKENIFEQIGGFFQDAGNNVSKGVGQVFAPQKTQSQPKPFSPSIGNSQLTMGRVNQQPNLQVRQAQPSTLRINQPRKPVVKSYEDAQRSNPLSDLGNFGATVGKGIVGTGQRIGTTAAQGAASLGTAGAVGIYSALGNKKGVEQEVKNYKNFMSDINKSKAIDDGKLSFISEDVQKGTASPAKFGAEFTKAGVDTSGFVLPQAKAATFVGNIGRNAAIEGTLGTAADAADQYATNGNVNLKEALKSGVINASLGGGMSAIGGTRRAVSGGRASLRRGNPALETAGEEAGELAQRLAETGKRPGQEGNSVANERFKVKPEDINMDEYLLRGTPIRDTFVPAGARGASANPIPGSPNRTVRVKNVETEVQRAINEATQEAPQMVRVTDNQRAAQDISRTDQANRLIANARREEIRDAPLLQDDTGAVLPNRGFDEYTDQLLRNAGVDIDSGLVGGNVLYNNPITKTFNKGQQKVIEAIDSARDVASSGIRRGLDSENDITSGISRLPQIGFKNFGRSDAERGILTGRSSRIQSAGNVARAVQNDLEQAVKATGDVETTNRRIYQVLETPEYLDKVYKDPTKLTLEDLSPEELNVMEKLIQSNKIRNDINLETGLITPDQHAQYADGLHSPRIYDLTTEGQSNLIGGSKLLDNKAGIKRKDITQIDDAVTDNALKSPTLASSVRLEMALRNKANQQALDELAQAKLILDRAPNKNYVKLEGKQFGEYNGKYIDKQIKSQLDGQEYFNSDLGQATSNLVDKYQDSVLGTVDRFNKKTKTVFAPATNIGNIASNVLAFSGAANVNPGTVAVRMAQAGKQLAGHNKKINANVYRAEKAGLFSGDTGRQLVGTNDDQLKTLTKHSKNPIKAIESFYGKTDQAAALGIFNELKARGLTDQQAVRRAHKAVQDYNNAGRGINVLADSPILGKPFARFTPELLRIAKNNAIYNPVGTATKVGALAAGGAALSQSAGETTEERQARENQIGQTQLPFTGGINSLITGGKNTDNVSLNLPIGDSAVNVARVSGLNFPIEPGGDAESALGKSLNPVADLTRKTADGREVFAPNQFVSSMTGRPLADQIVNRDFMGRQITDPENRIISEIGKGKSQYENADGSRQSPGKEKEAQNRLRTLAQNYIPLANEGDALINAATKNKDYYGKDRTLKEAGLRAVGLKTESNSKEVREKRVSNKDFFEGSDKQVKTFLRDNPDVADAYYKVNDRSRDRNTNKKSSGIVTPEKWSVIRGETSGKLFNQLKQEAMDANKAQGKPFDPIFDLQDPARVKEVMNIRASAPGDNVEKEEILRATQPWYKAFEKAESKYYEDNSKFFEDIPKSKNPAGRNDREKSYSEVPYPEQTELVKNYYALKGQNADKAKEYFKNNADQLSADFDKYKAGKLANINGKREILGLDPIDQDTYNNVTFGYEDDEAKVARDLYYKGVGGGYGGRGGGNPNKILIRSSDYDGVINVDDAPSAKITATNSKPKVQVKKRQKRTAKVTSTKVKS